MITYPCLKSSAGLSNTLRLKQNGRHFADDIFKHIFLNANVWISIEISLKFVPQGQINNIQALVQIMAWRRPGDKPLSEPMMVSFTEAYMRHSASMSWYLLVKGVPILKLCASVSKRVFNTDQAALWMVQSICVSVRLSVRPPVTPFSLCSHNCITLKCSGVITNDKSDVHAKGQDQRLEVKCQGHRCQNPI